MHKRSAHGILRGQSRRLFTLVCSAALALLPDAGLAAPSLKTSSVAEAMEQLKAGEYLWTPAVAPEGPVVVIVSLKSQHAHVYRNGIPIGMSTVSTGKPGYTTPTGVFTVLQKHVEHKSNLYQNAPMPYMQRLTWDGIAMHAGNVPGYPASHGCIRLPMEFAELLFGVTRVGLTVVITNDEQLPQVAPPPTVLKQNPDLKVGTLPAADTFWQPARAPAGPVSIVISTADKRLLVLRNGVEIGSAPVSINGAPAGTSVYLLRAIDPAGFHWLRVPLDGEVADTNVEEHGQLSLAEDFRRSLASIVTPGTTVLVTPDTLRSGNAGQQMTVISGEN
ncbi:L,D-transpeptidase [Sphingopyxis chilensis]